MPDVADVFFFDVIFLVFIIVPRISRLNVSVYNAYANKRKITLGHYNNVFSLCLLSFDSLQRRGRSTWCFILRMHANPTRHYIDVWVPRDVLVFQLIMQNSDRTTY